MMTPDHSPLGNAVTYASGYDAGLLFPIARAAGRAELGLGRVLPFVGVDIWNAYELSWLDRRGKPEVALAEFRFGADSPNIVESKSFKLYLNGFSQERIDGADAVRDRLHADLAIAAGATVEVALTLPRDFTAVAIREPEGLLIDDIEIAIDRYGAPDPDLLECDASNAVEEMLVSNLLKSNCPVTGQPDWASVRIAYTGPRIDRTGLLRYLVSFRDHAGFHEQCVERIFVDILERCAPSSLEVYARYTRRGGLDINPWRSTHPGCPFNPRGARQ